MADPYTPTRVQVSTETVDRLEELLRRLRVLGCTDEEIDGVSEAWDDPTWAEEERYELAHLSDAALVREVRAAREDAAYHSRTPDEQAEIDEERAFFTEVDKVNLQAFREVHGSVPEVRQWVGDDAARAYAALVFETTAPGADPGVGRARKGVVEPLSRIVEDGGPEAVLAKITVGQ